MRADATFIAVEVDDATAADAELARKLTEACPVDIFAQGSGGALEIVDSFVGRMLSSISSIARILSATTVVVGMQPAVAITLIELGLSLEGVRTALNVERGMELLRRTRRESHLGN